MVAPRAKRTADLSHLPRAPALARQARAACTSNSRQRHSPAKDLWNLSHLWNRLFPPR
jgi:hypothetical protein